MSYPYPAPYPPPYQPAPRPVNTSTTGPKVLTFIGIAMLVLAIATGVGAVVAIASGVSNATAISSELDEVAITTIPPGQTETITLVDNTMYTLWIESGTGSTSSRPVVTDPTGDSVTLSTNYYSDSDWEAGESLEGWRFTSGSAGPYEITTASDGPTLQLLQGFDLDLVLDGFTGAAQTIGGVFLAIVAVALFLTGLGLTIGGGVWWASRAKNARQMAQTGQPMV